ncbi:MAG: TM0106 family RecB-like putative nuclease, partial [Desulfuromonadales bacterium]|nr:TM0106 family RecB-like putative nuclease [Desulfuromonadales bacterium]
TLQKLQRQAALQHLHRTSGEDIYEYLEVDPLEERGFQRLPRPDEGDLFFDMEGDPLEEGGLEYLFGLYYLDQGRFVFKPFWAHNRQEERRALQDFMAFVMERLARSPSMHIYHYAPYEETALKRLMSLHGTCEAEVDHLLRSNKLVDLYKVVSEAILISEPRYSIKNLEQAPDAPDVFEKSFIRVCATHHATFKPLMVYLLRNFKIPLRIIIQTRHLS